VKQKMKFVVLGAGLQGRIAAADLVHKELSPDPKDVTIADYNFEAAKRAEEQFGVKAVQCDVSDPEKLAGTIEGADVVLNCVQDDWNIAIMEACIKAKTHYIDLGGLFHKTRKQFELHEEFLANDILAVLGMGATPGIMNVLAGYAAERLDTIREAHAYCGCGDFTRTSAVFGIPYSLRTIVRENTLEPWILHEGELMPVPIKSGAETVQFPEPLGTTVLRYCIHSEPAQFARSFKDKGIQEASFRLALTEDFEQKMAFLSDLGFGSDEEVDVKGQKVSPLETLISVVNKYVKEYDASEDGPVNDVDILRVVMKGTKDGIEKEYTVECIARSNEKLGYTAGDLDTGTTPSVVAQMIAKGLIKDRGVLSPEQCIPPIPFFKELSKREMPVYVSEKTPLSDNDFELLNFEINRPK
jgi:saccharopine dehydrogenase-like NADP-dependent oxidoreductase